MCTTKDASLTFLLRVNIMECTIQIPVYLPARPPSTILQNVSASVKQHTRPAMKTTNFTVIFRILCGEFL